jgi:hypothetical protein
MTMINSEKNLNDAKSPQIHVDGVVNFVRV